MQKLSRSLIALGGLAALAACGDDVSITPPTPTPVAVVGVTVSPASLSLKVGESATLGVSVEATGGAGTSVTWASSNNAVATVSATGAVTAVAAGNTTVRATSTVDNTKSGAAQVTVTAPAVRSVVVSPATVSLQVGQSVTAIATVDRDAGASGAVTWASSNAAVATVTSAGVIAGVAQGTAVISATSTADATKAGALSVTVVPVPNTLIALSVAPTNANLGVGSTVQLVPSATTAGSAAVTYTYATSNASVATVSTSGLVTAVGNGTAVITTTAATATNSLSVATTINVASASVSISTITTGGLGTPVNLANVAGQIEVTMNVSAGNQTLDSVRVKLGSQAAASQGFTVNGAPNAPVTLSINTAEYAINADSTSTVRYLNGSTGVQAELFVRGASGPTASNTITINLNNLDTFHARWALPTTSAIAPATGLQWYGGPSTTTTINAIPVMYSGNTITSATLHMDDFSVAGNASLCGAAVTDAAAPFTASFACTGITNTTVQPGVAASLRGDGNPGPAGVGGNSATGFHTVLFANAGPLVQGAAIPVRIDVAGPATATYAWVAGTTFDYWANASFRFDTSTSGIFSRSRAADGGVGASAASTDVYEFEDRAVSGTAWAVHTANTNNIPENAADFTVNAYNGRVTEKDLLGNATITYLGNTTTSPGQNFGVDTTMPTLTYLTTALEPRIALPATDTLGNTKILTNDGNIANTTRADSAYFGVRYTDTRSGFNLNNGTEAQYIRITRIGQPGAPGASTCVLGVVSSSVCNFARRVGVVDATDLTQRRDTTGVYGSGVNFSGGATGDLYTPATAGDSAGYYTYETYVVDRAGNATATISKTVAVDVDAPLATGLNPAAAGLVAGSANVWLPIGADELEVLDAAFAMRYPDMADGTATDTIYFDRKFITDFKAGFSGLPLAGLVGPGQTYGNSGITLPVNFFRGVDTVLVADSTAPATVSATYKPTTAMAEMYDIRSFTSSSVVYPNLSSGFYSTVILPSQISNGAVVSLGAAGSQWYVFGTGTTGSTIQAEVRQTTVINNAPFTQVAFFRAPAAGTGRWIYLGTVATASPNDQGGNRFWRYTLSGVAPSLATGDRIRAVGITASGDALSTQTRVQP